MRVLLLMVCLASAACVDSKSPASGANNRPESGTRDGALYDGCTSDDQCDSGLCKDYLNRGVQLCTEACSASNPCPAQNGVSVVCNNMGFCRPDAPNACAAP